MGRRRGVASSRGVIFQVGTKLTQASGNLVRLTQVEGPGATASVEALHMAIMSILVAEIVPAWDDDVRERIVERK